MYNESETVTHINNLADNDKLNEMENEVNNLKRQLISIMRNEQKNLLEAQLMLLAKYQDNMSEAVEEIKEEFESGELR